MKELKPCPFCGGEAILGDIRMTTLAYSPRIRTTYRRVFVKIAERRLSRTKQRRMQSTHGIVERRRQANNGNKVYIRLKEQGLYMPPWMHSMQTLQWGFMRTAKG